MSEVYDRHEYIKDLTGAGLDEQQAEAIAKGAVQVQENTLATKADIAWLRTELAKQESRLTNKMYAAMAVQATLIIALIKLFPAV